jgi:lambda repressor-like predicted transcriptional regulator
MPNSSTSSRRKTTRLDLVALRVNAGHSRESLSLKTGLGRETIRMAEAGWLPTPRVQFAIAAAYGLKPLELWPIESQRRLSPVKRKAVAA